MPAVALKIDKLGRVVIPVDYRRKMRIKPGDRLYVEFGAGELRLRTMDAVVARVQEALRPYRPKDGVLRSEELIKERRDEAVRE
jgi:AbrB family looped-hinge helix DNA binding protein